MALIGNPTKAAVPVTPDLMHGYKLWLRNEHCMLCHELTGYDVNAQRWSIGSSTSTILEAIGISAGRTRTTPLAGWPDAPQPSTRAAIVLSAVGCSLT